MERHKLCHIIVTVGARQTLILFRYNYFFPNSHVISLPNVVHVQRNFPDFGVGQRVGHVMEHFQNQKLLDVDLENIQSATKIKY